MHIGLFRIKGKINNAKKYYSPNKNAMQISLSTTIGNITPIFMFLQLPETSEPIQDPYFKLSGVNPIVTFNEWVAKVIYGEVL